MLVLRKQDFLPPQSKGFIKLQDMAWTKPEFAHHQVDAAGDVLISPEPEVFSLEESEKTDKALGIINNWRSSHSCPLQSMKMTLLNRAKKIDGQSLIAQRIKRMRASILEGLKAASEDIEKKTGHFFLLQLNSKERRITTTRFQEGQLAEAQNRYLALEKANKDKPEVQTVLVSVDSVEHLRKAYPNYFLDIGEFVNVLKKILD